MAIHPTALIAPGVELHETVEIGPYVIIEKGARIGARTRVMPYVHINGETTIGEDNVIHMGAVVGHEPQHLSYDGSPRRLVIGDRNRIREYASIHRAYEPEGETRIGDDCFLMGFSHVGHDCKLGNRVILANGALLAGHVDVEDGANISGNCAVHQFVHVGRYAMLQGLAGVSKDIVPYVIVRGGAVNRVGGINTVGLRRAGFSPAARSEIKEAYRTLFREGHSVPRALELLRVGGYGPEVGHVIAFIERSKRGICNQAGGD